MNALTPDASRDDADVEGLVRLRLLASAVAGRPVDVVPAGPGDSAWTDGWTIYVDPGRSREDRLRLVCVQASLLGAGSLVADVVEKIDRRPTVGRRYLTIEGHRALATLEPVLPGALWPYIDHDVAARTASPRQSLDLARGRDTIPDPPDAFGTIRPRALRHVAQRSDQGVVTDHRPRRASDTLRELDDDEQDERPSPDFLSSPVGGSGPIGRLLKRVLGDGRSAESGPPGADAQTHRDRSGARGSRGMPTTAALGSTPSLGGSVRYDRATYPEWDVHQRRYRRSWCTVSELGSPSPDHPYFSFPDALAVRRALARLGMTLERRSRQLQGTDIDIDAAVDAYVERLAGSPAEEGLYIDYVRHRRDLAALVLLDISGSAGQPSATGGTVHEHQRATAAALTRALHDLGDRVGLYAFRSQGRSAVDVLPLKRFHEPMDAGVVGRLSGCTPGAYTRLGAAIRHSATVLERDGGLSRRLLIVLSDGFAYDHGYEGAYGEADARRALVEARHRGIACVCLSVGATTDPAALRRVFGSAAHAGVARFDDLGAVVGPLFRFALRSAEAQRRDYQRSMRRRERAEMERVR